MIAVAWNRRPLEERVNLDPAFLAILLREAVSGYFERTRRPMPLPLAFIALPIVLHRGTRERLPRTLATSLPVWLQENQFLRETFADRARAVASATREGVIIALQTKLLRISHSALVIDQEPLQPRYATAETRTMHSRARFVGRWLAQSGDVETVYFLWGVKP